MEIDNKRIIELLELVKDYLLSTKFHQSGICKALRNAYCYSNTFTSEEYKYIDRYLTTHKPTDTNQYKEFTQNPYWTVNPYWVESEIDEFWWVEINKEPVTRQIRIDYINALINNLK